MTGTRTPVRRARQPAVDEKQPAAHTRRLATRSRMSKFACRGSRISLALSGAMLVALASATSAQDLARPGPIDWEIDATTTILIEPGTLRIRVRLAGDETLVLSDGVDGLGHIALLRSGGRKAVWAFEDTGITVRAEWVSTAKRAVHPGRGLDQGRLIVRVTSDKARKIAWPVVPAKVKDAAFVVPIAEGVHVRRSDAALSAWLAKRGAMSATADLSMPFVGVEAGTRTITSFVPAPYYASLLCARDAARWTHEWTANRKGADYVVGFVVSARRPLAAARAYRAYLRAQPEWRPLAAKIAANPRVERLLGAPHAYVWGSDLFTRNDVPRPKWKAFARALLADAAKPDSLAARLLAAAPATRKSLEEITKLEWPHRYATGLAAAGITAALRTARFAQPKQTGAATGGRDEPESAEREPSRRGRVEHAQGNVAQRAALELAKRVAQARANANAFAAAYRRFVAPLESWGDGVSTTLLDSIKKAGIDRLLVCTSDLDAADDQRHVAQRADELGFLFGPYDSFHSIHSPDARADDTWITAQFGRELYEKGRIVGLDGVASAGFKKRGFHLSPSFAWPWVKARVEARLALVPHSAWFVDCDAFGQFFDDTHAAHSATRVGDAAARRARLRWLSKTKGLVVGSEGGSAVMVPAFHFGHGVMTPVIGWGDQRLRARDSEFYHGRYWPPDAPERFFKAVHLPKDLERPWFDPRDRLPLYQAVFGDCVITTHHWGGASLRYKDHVDTVQLLELLYLVPPLYHLNRDRWAKDKQRITKHFAFWSPLHRKLAKAPLVDFAWLSKDRLVQRTSFETPEGLVHLTANFATEPRKTAEVQVPPRSVQVTGAIEVAEGEFGIAQRR